MEMRPKSIHGSRTIMFAELDKVMASALDSREYLIALDGNVFGKKSSGGKKKTAAYLKHLYGFDIHDPLFSAFEYFWKLVDIHERPMLAILFAITRDKLLAASVDIIQTVTTGRKVQPEYFEAEIEKQHPNFYSSTTIHSTARNIISSWKQAGFIEGKVKNIRVEPRVGFLVACFAFLIAYLQGVRGNFIWSSIAVRALCLPESELRELAIECSRKDLMQYQFAGNVTSISFTGLLRKIGINGNPN